MPWCGFNETMARGLTEFVCGLGLELRQRTDDMTFCGMNDTMAGGLNEFGAGLAVQTEKRAHDECVPLTGIPVIELAELNVLNEALRQSPKQKPLAGIIALGLFVTFLYEKLDKRLKTDPSLTAEQAFAAIMAEQNALLFAMEDHYYENLRPNFERSDAIRRIVSFLEERV